MDKKKMQRQVSELAHGDMTSGSSACGQEVTTSDRHAFRADWHDYNGGIYFITICSHKKKHIFGCIRDSQFYPTSLGALITEHISRISNFHKDVEVWNSVVMPNHIHMVISVGTRLIASTASGVTPNPSVSASVPSPGCLKPPKHGEALEYNHHNSRLAVVIGSFKAGVTRTARTRLIASLPCWQPRYHEHIIRNQHALDNIMNYIDLNVSQWSEDCFNDNASDI